MKRANGTSVPVTPADAPAWFVAWAQANETVLRALLRENEALRTRLTAAGIA